VPDESVASIAQASSATRICTTGVERPVDTVLAEVAPAIDDHGGYTRTLQALEFREGVPRFAGWAGFGQSRHQVVRVEARALRGPPNGFRVVDVEPLDPGRFEQGLIEQVTLFGIGRVEGTGRQFSR